MLTSPPLREFNPGARTRDLVRPEEDPGLVPRTALYRFYDRDKALLYIGITGQPIERWAKHRRQARWWPAAAYVSVEIPPTRGRPSTQNASPSAPNTPASTSAAREEATDAAHPVHQA